MERGVSLEIGCVDIGAPPDQVANAKRFVRNCRHQKRRHACLIARVDIRSVRKRSIIFRPSGMTECADQLFIDGGEGLLRRAAFKQNGKDGTKQNGC